MYRLDDLGPCVRPMIKAPQGKKLVVADLSAIENRALMWLSGCDEGLAIYSEGRDPYKDFATRLYGIEYEAVTSKQRQICKPPVLGCGYGLGAGMERKLSNGRVECTGLRKYAENMGIALDARQSVEMVQEFRTSFPEVPAYWKFLEQAFHAAVKTGQRQQVGAIWFGAITKAGSQEVEAVYAELPSGRKVYYQNPRAWQGSKGLEIRYDGLRNGVWWSVTSWGGVICENIVQAFSRDVLVEGMLAAEQEGLTVVMHCHDEIVAEVEHRRVGAAEILKDCMRREISWAPGLPLDADGYESERYLKN